MSYYLSEIKHYVSVDCVIFGFQQGSLNLLLLKRKMEPAQGQWSLMGGFVRSDESVDDAAKRVLAELTGLENVYMEQVHTFGAVGRDPGERVISVVYYALINIDEYDREAIYGEAMDKRNFRKRVADMDYIEKTDKIDKESSKRGAALYKFNANAYNRTHTKFKL